MRIGPDVARIALATALAAGAGAMPASAAAPPAPAARADEASLDAVLAAPRLDPAAVDALYRRAVLRGEAATLDARIAAIAARADAPARVRAAAHLARALLAWQRGRMAEAVQAAEAGAALAPGSDALLLRARLLDATGRPGPAASLYAEAAAAESDAAARDALLLRAAIARVAVDPAQTPALARLAAGTSPVARDRIATLLAVLGRPAEALTIDRGAAGGDAARQIRVAQWAIAAGDRAAGRDAAWAAYRAAADLADRRYALALLAESFRKAGDLPGLLAFLRDRPADPATTQLRADVLVETGRFDDAIALVRDGAGGALRPQLPALLDLAGRREALIAEYERLIARDPAEPRWYDALAVLYMSAGRRDDALAVYRRLVAAAPDSLPVVTEAARRMIAMGLTDPALALVERLGRDPRRVVAVRFFQFDSEVARGRPDAARAALADLDRRLPPRDPQRVALADGYERLGDGGAALRVLTALEAAGDRFDYDAQVHVAQLASGEGQDAAALARLRALWPVTTLPARRSYLEGQIVGIATRLGQADALATAIAARVAAGDRRDFELLVALRQRAGDATGTRAAIAAFARAPGGDRVDTLRRTAAAQARTGDRDAYRATLRTLVEADPARAETYLQQLTREATRPGATDAAGLDALLARLNAARGSDPASARRFAAAVHALAGQPDRAIALYREAVAVAPDDEDALLALVALLNGRGARAEAIGTLQYRAEFASDEATRARALDALAGTLAATSGGAEAEQAPQFAAVRLAWGERLLLWRLGRSGGDAALYDTLADVAEQAGDGALQRRVREAALAVPGTSRAATLRQLVTLSTGAGGDLANAGPAVGDNEGKATYGRRLVALRQPYPADVYAELARAMLAQRDLAGAERAFAMIEDIPGLVDVDALRGDAYLAAGYLPRALAGYSRALLRDRTDPALVLKTAILHEQVGDRALARDLYWTGLRDALAREPARRGADRAGTPLDPQPFLDSLLEGLLLTWPADAAARAAITAALDRMTQDALTAAPPEWGVQVRVRRLLDAARRIAAAGRDPAPLDAIDARLATRFGSDATFVRDRAAFRDLTGMPRALPAPAVDGIDGTLRVQAGDDGNAELELALALDRHDAAAVTALFATAIDGEAARRAAPSDGAPTYDTPLNAMLMLLAGRVSAADLRTTALDPLARRGIAEGVLFDLFRSAPDRFAALEKTAGAPLLPPDRLIALIGTRFGDPIPLRASLRRRGGPPRDPVAMIVARFPIDGQIALVETLAGGGDRAAAASGLLPPLERAALSAPLDAGRLARLQQAMIREAETAPEGGRLAGRLLGLIDLPAANRPLLLAVARALAARQPGAAAVPATIEAWFAGDRAGALERLLARYDALDPQQRDDDYTAGVVTATFAAVRREQAAAFLADPAPDAARRAWFYRRYVAGAPWLFGTTDEEVVVYLRRLVTLEPDNPVYVAGLLVRSWASGDRAGFTTLLSAYVDGHRDDREAAAALQLAQLLARRPDAARATAQAAGADVADPEWLIELVNRARRAAADAGAPPGFRTVFGAVYETARTEAADLPAIAAVETRRRDDRTAATPLAADPLAPVTGATPTDAPVVLRGVWRRSAAGAERPADPEAATRFALLDRITEAAAAPAPAPDRAALTATPAMTREVEDETTALAAVLREQQQPLYDLVAAGAIGQGDAAARIDALFARLRDGTADAHALQSLATLAVRSGRVPDAAELALVRGAVARLPAMSAGRRILWSILFARAGDHATARTWLEGAAMQILYPGPAGLGLGMRPADFGALVAALREWSDRPAAVAAHAALAARIEAERAVMPPDDVPGPLPPLDVAPDAMSAAPEPVPGP